MRIAPEGWPIIIVTALIAAGISALALWLGPAWLAHPTTTVCVLLVLWALWFFRDPEREAPPAPPGQDMLISPADGKVIKIDQAELPPEIRSFAKSSGPRQRVAIFLNLFNVHVNCVPASGRIVKLAYVPGKFINASFDKASEHNERSLALMVDRAGREIGFVQIAGLVARRIINHLKEGQQVRLGERFGLIRFGSRAEVYLPEGAVLQVKVGDKVAAGESILALVPAAASAAESSPAPAESRA